MSISFLVVGDILYHKHGIIIIFIIKMLKIYKNDNSQYSQVHRVNNGNTSCFY